MLNFVGGWRLFIACGVSLAVPASFAMAQTPSKAAPVSEQLKKLKTSELIDQLAELSSKSDMDCVMILSDVFLPLPYVERAGNHPPPDYSDVSPVMRELEARGAKALPDLLNHLDDKRVTKLTLRGKDTPLLAKFQCNEYDPRYRDPKKRPQRVALRAESKLTRPFESYTIRIGDLCYTAIGQIVNRSLRMARGQATNGFIVNSPVETPALAMATRQEWSSLTEEEHIRSLSQDANDLSDEWAAPRALWRLWAYYPKTGEELALTFLRRPLYAGAALDEFIGKLFESEPAKWNTMIEEFKKRNGQASIDVIPSYLDRYFRKSYDDRQDLRTKADEILTIQFPVFDRIRPPFINAASADEARDLVFGLENLHSEKLDAAIFELFHRATKFDSKLDDDRRACDTLADICMHRLASKGHNAEFRDFCAKRIKEIEMTPQNSRLREILPDLRSFLKQFGG